MPYASWIFLNNQQGTRPHHIYSYQYKYVPNIGALKYIKLADINREIDRNTITVGNFNISLTSVDGFSIQKTNKTTVVLNGTID